MMMPANYSVIAENEMTYVNGGASFIDAIGAVTAPIWNLDNVKAFSTNIVTLIGNNFVTSTIQNTLGYVFGGSATKADLGTMSALVALTWAPCSARLSALTSSRLASTATALLRSWAPLLLSTTWAAPRSRTLLAM